MLIEKRGGGFKLRWAIDVVNGRTIDFVRLVYYKGRLRSFLSMHKHEEVRDGVQG